MRLHAREQAVVMPAATDLTKRLLEWTQSHSLTTTESLVVVSSALSSYVNSLLKYQLRMERHNDTDTPSGLAAQPEED